MMFYGSKHILNEIWNKFILTPEFFIWINSQQNSEDEDQKECQKLQWLWSWFKQFELFHCKTLLQIHVAFLKTVMTPQWKLKAQLPKNHMVKPVTKIYHVRARIEGTNIMCWSFHTKAELYNRILSLWSLSLWVSRMVSLLHRVTHPRLAVE